MCHKIQNVACQNILIHLSPDLKNSDFSKNLYNIFSGVVLFSTNDCKQIRDILHTCVTYR